LKTTIESAPTVLETAKTKVDADYVKNNTNLHLSHFHSYQIVWQFASTGGEADIYLMSKNQQYFILKLYRFGIEPKKEVVEKLKIMSREYPQDIVKIYEIDLDNGSNRWYEIQEYIKYGSLMKLKNQKLDSHQIRYILMEIAKILHSIHSQNIIHRDLKPDNILIREKKPLNLVIIDFGISSVLDSEVSKRMTTKSGTKLYFAPESFAGIIGKEVDYWALGMILLELTIGDNIFNELDENYIAYTINTKNIPIPKEIDSNLSYLMKGLLTRDPDKRWGHSEIKRWLNGDKNIPLEYGASDGEYEKPYIIDEQKFYSLRDLVTTFASCEKMWEEGKSHFYRGYITKWLENNGDFDKSLQIDEIKKTSDDDFGLFKLIYTYCDDLDFVLCGKLINSQNLMLYIANYIKESCSSHESMIILLILRGKILDYYKIYKEATNPEDDFEKILNTVVTYYKKNYHVRGEERLQDILIFLKACVDKKKYYLSYNVVMANEKLLINRYGFDMLKKRFSLPNEILEMVESLNFDYKKVKYINKLMAFEMDNYYIPIDFNDELQKNFMGTIDKLNRFVPKQVVNEKVELSLVPKFLKKMIEDATFKDYFYIIDKFRGLQTLSKTRLTDLKKIYYLPNIQTDIEESEFDDFSKKISYINDLLEDNLAISKKTFDKLSVYIPQNIQEEIVSAKYNLRIAQAIDKLNNFKIDGYILPHSFIMQVKNNFFYLIDNLENCLNKSYYEDYFIPKNIKDELQVINFKTYLSHSQLIKKTAISKEFLMKLRIDKEFLKSVNLNLANVDNIDKETLRKLKKIENSNVDREAYVKLMKIFPMVQKQGIIEVTTYLKKLKSLNVKWQSNDSKIIDYIYNYKITVKTTPQSRKYGGAIQISWVMIKILIFVFIFIFASRNMVEFGFSSSILVFYIPIAGLFFFSRKNFKFIKIYTQPLTIILEELIRHPAYSNRISFLS